MATNEEKALYGVGIKFPLEERNGRLEMTEGYDRIWDAVEMILTTPRGTCALDPNFGLEVAAFDELAQPESVAWLVAKAIERSEPRAKDITVKINRLDTQNGVIYLEIFITPIATDTVLNRIYPIYQASA